MREENQGKKNQNQEKEQDQNERTRLLPEGKGDGGDVQFDV